MSDHDKRCLFNIMKGKKTSSGPWTRMIAFCEKQTEI